MIDISEVEKHVAKEMENVRKEKPLAILIGEIHLDPYHAAFKHLLAKKAEKHIKKPVILLEGATAGDQERIYAAIEYGYVPTVQKRMEHLVEKGIIPKTPPIYALTKNDLRELLNRISSMQASENIEDKEIRTSLSVVKGYLRKMLMRDKIYARTRMVSGITGRIPVDGLEDPKAIKDALKAVAVNAYPGQIHEIRNKIFAKRIEEYVSKGFTPIAIMGEAHVDDVKQILEGKGIKAHVIKIGKKTISEDDLKLFEEILEEQAIDALFG